MTEYTQLGIVGLFVAALLGARAALVRWGSGSWLRQQRPADVEVGARAVLAPNQTVTVLRWRDRDFLVASGPAGFSVLAEEPPVRASVLGSNS